ncbi:MAG: hypothetical protein AB7Q29_09235 [Vicinamibacterales bacterium]
MRRRFAAAVAAVLAVTLAGGSPANALRSSPSSSALTEQLPFGTPACEYDPAADIPDFGAFELPPEKDALDHIVENCTAPLTKAADGLAKVHAELQGMQTALSEAANAVSNVQADVASTQQALREVKDVNEMLSRWRQSLRAIDVNAVMDTVTGATEDLAVGFETYALQCIGGATWSYLQAQLPQNVQDAMALRETVHDTVSDAQAQAGESLKSLDKLSQMDPLRSPAETKRELRHLQSLAGTLLQTIQTLEAHGEAMLTLTRDFADVVSHPERLLADASEMEVASNRVQRLLQEMNTSCDVEGAQTELSRVTERGKRFLLDARVATAHARTDEQRLLHDPLWTANPPSATTLRPDYQRWLRARTTRMQLEQASGDMHEMLNRVGGMCSVFHGRRQQVEQHERAFVDLVESARRAITACDLTSAQQLIGKVEAAEATACGPRLGVALRDADASKPILIGATDAAIDRPPLGDTGNVTTSRPDSTTASASATLRARLADARRSCPGASPDPFRVNPTGAAASPAAPAAGPVYRLVEVRREPQDAAHAPTSIKGGQTSFDLLGSRSDLGARANLTVKVPDSLTSAPFTVEAAARANWQLQNTVSMYIGVSLNVLGRPAGSNTGREWNEPGAHTAQTSQTVTTSIGDGMVRGWQENGKQYRAIWINWGAWGCDYGEQITFVYEGPPAP